MGDFCSFDGTRLHYVDLGDASARAVVLLHGFAADIVANWERPGIVDALRADGFRVIGLDARGHGRSDKPHDPAAYSHEAMVRDAQELLDALGVGGCSLVGYSMGSMIASRLAGRDERVGRLVLGGIGGRARFVRPEATARGIADALEAHDASSVESPAARAFRAFADATGADRAAMAAIQRGRPFDDPDLAAITVPTLVVVGEGDALARRPEQLAAAMVNAPTTIRIVPGNHLSAVAKPEFSQAVRAFLAEA